MKTDPARPPWTPFLVAVSSMAIAGVLGLTATTQLALRTSRGLRLDRAALDAVSRPALVLNHLYQGRGSATFAIGVLPVGVTLAVARRRFDLALGAVVVIGGANLTTRALKYGLFARLDLGEGTNTLPSGHTTVALSLAIAAVIVAPPTWRSAVGDRRVGHRSPGWYGDGLWPPSPTL